MKFIWEIHGELIKSEIDDFVVIMMDYFEFRKKLPPNKGLPRLTTVYSFMDRGRRAWMPVIKLMANYETAGINGHKYIQGSHTAFLASSFTKTICFMVPKKQIRFFRLHLQPYEIEVFEIAEYRRFLDNENQGKSD